MEKFWNRFKFYLVGVAFGSVFVYFLFGNRGCAWLPENRVKNLIGEKEILVSDSVLAVMACNNITNVDIYNLLKSDGDVEFDLSQTQTTPKIYYITSQNKDGVYAAEFILDEENKRSYLKGIHKDKLADCPSNIQQNEFHVLSLPRNDVYQIITSHEFRILTDAKCQMQALGLSEEEVLNFHTNSTIDLKNSEPRLHPNPIYVLSGKISGNAIKITYIIGENRTRISKIDGEKETDC